ncbi:hypothetical protein D3C86_2163040 [compost metagenome]
MQVTRIASIGREREAMVGERERVALEPVAEGNERKACLSAVALRRETFGACGAQDRHAVV